MGNGISRGDFRASSRTSVAGIVKSVNYSYRAAETFAPRTRREGIFFNADGRVLMDYIIIPQNANSPVAVVLSGIKMAVYRSGPPFLTPFHLPSRTNVARINS